MRLTFGIHLIVSYRAHFFRMQCVLCVCCVCVVCVCVVCVCVVCCVCCVCYVCCVCCLCVYQWYGGHAHRYRVRA